jgi:hypothetical protein
MSEQSSHVWSCQPKAEKLLLNILEECWIKNPFIEQLHKDLEKHTSSRLFDWIDHLVIAHSPMIRNNLEEAGFVNDQTTSSYRVFYHPGAQLPRLIVKDRTPTFEGVGIKVDSISDFLMIRGMVGCIEGSPFSGFRRCSVSTNKGVSLWAIERRGTHAMEPVYEQEKWIERYLEASEKWQTRPRDLEDEDEAIKHTLIIAEELVSLVGQNVAAWIVLECERKYWQARNTAAQLQKNRQDRLGMGWANHDHHTFRSSRKYFTQLVRLFEMLGFHCRERFYAGEEAGWGAQVMENSQCGLVLFLDLDLAPKELEIDFAHHPLQELSHLGTVGLWCALHGDSILKGGMHHLEAQFLFEDLTEDLTHQGISMMEPFSNFSYLKQAFTSGEQWVVDPKRVNKLVREGKLSHHEADKFIQYGAVGSHLENLQRREGYKGFNQKNVSYIIQKTDPRKSI